MYLLCRLVVAGFLLVELYTVSLVEHDCAHVVLAHELSACWILTSWHESLTHLAHEVVFPVWYVFVGSVRVVVVFCVALLVLACIFVSELEGVAIESL